MIGLLLVLVLVLVLVLLVLLLMYSKLGLQLVCRGHLRPDWGLVGSDLLIKEGWRSTPIVQAVRMEPFVVRCSLDCHF